MGGLDSSGGTGRPEPGDSRHAAVTSAGRRLDGWKAIAGYFKRDRSTVMRWAAERDLPIRRLPGGSVFAFEHDLAAWSIDPPVAEEAARSTSEAAVASSTTVATQVAGPARPFAMRVMAIVITVAALTAALAIWLVWRSPAARGPDAMPSSPTVAQTYIQARDIWARRQPADIARSIQLYREVIRQEPGFAPAYAGLADSWLVYREYGDVNDASAYRQARLAAERALALDPTLPSAHRAIGFIHYWWDNDPTHALADFARSLALDPRDGQTHFWYANVLADLGRDTEAQREYGRARLILPGSHPIAVEHACSQAMAGRIALGRAQLGALSKATPGDPTIYGCLAWIAVGQGDILATAQEYRRIARLRGEPGLLKLSADLDAAVRRDPTTAHRVLIADERRELVDGTRRLRQTPAYVASAMGDRPELIALLHEAVSRDEKWYTASMTEAMIRKWHEDREVVALVSRLQQPKPVAPSLE